MSSRKVPEIQLMQILARSLWPIRWFDRVFVPGPRTVVQRIDSYWRWISLLVFLLIPLDMMMTLLGASAIGVSGEVNPLMKWGLQQGIAMLVIINVISAVLVVAFFHFLLWLLPWMSETTRPYFALMLELQIGLGIAFGVWLFATNLSVYLFQDNVFLDTFLQILKTTF